MGNITKGSKTSPFLEPKKIEVYQFPVREERGTYSPLQIIEFRFRRQYGSCSRWSHFSDTQSLWSEPCSSFGCLGQTLQHCGWSAHSFLAPQSGHHLRNREFQFKIGHQTELYTFFNDEYWSTSRPWWQTFGKVQGLYWVCPLITHSWFILRSLIPKNKCKEKLKTHFSRTLFSPDVHALWDSCSPWKCSFPAPVTRVLWMKLTSRNAFWSRNLFSILEPMLRVRKEHSYFQCSVQTRKSLKPFKPVFVKFSTMLLSVAWFL